MGVLPLLPLALLIWFEKHSPAQGAGVPAVLTATLALNFVGSGAGPEFRNLGAFLSAYAAATGSQDDYNTTFTSRCCVLSTRHATSPSKPRRVRLIPAMQWSD